MSIPNMKYEHSPVESLADSFVSSPGALYPQQFDDSLELPEGMTPPYDQESMFGGDSIMGGSMAGTPAPEKKPVKKRKSWGQELPTPKTALPPRKRAKTEDEKEQRRVERVLRNRRAAQSSRERKRQEVEALETEKTLIERRNRDLEMRLAQMEADNLMLLQENQKLQASLRGSSAASSPRQSESLRHTPPPSITFSTQLFTSQDDEHKSSISQQSICELSHSSPQTVNPASLSPSPEMRPVTELSNASFSDLTQHPAAMLCDLQCQSEKHRPWTSVAIAHLLLVSTALTMASKSILSPMVQISRALTQGSTLLPTPSILTTIMWMVTTPPTWRTTSTSANSSIKTTTSHNLRPKPRLQAQLLNRILACSPYLARPLLDATWEPMRLAFEEKLARDCLNSVDECERLDSSKSLSWEVLLSLQLAIAVFMKERIGEAKLDVATELRQSCGELDTLFSDPGSTVRVKSIHLGSGKGTAGKKSLEDWRPEF